MGVLLQASMSSTHSRFDRLEYVFDGDRGSACVKAVAAVVSDVSNSGAYKLLRALSPKCPQPSIIMLQRNMILRLIGR